MNINARDSWPRKGIYHLIMIRFLFFLWASAPLWVHAQQPLSGDIETVGDLLYEVSRLMRQDEVPSPPSPPESTSSVRVESFLPGKASEDAIPPLDPPISPIAPQDYSDKPAPKRRPPPAVVLHAIYGTGDNLRAALLVRGRYMDFGPGDQHIGVKVLSIRRDRVLLRQHGQKKTLRIGR